MARGIRSLDMRVGAVDRLPLELRLLRPDIEIGGRTPGPIRVVKIRRERNFIELPRIQLRLEEDVGKN